MQQAPNASAKASSTGVTTCMSRMMCAHASSRLHLRLKTLLKNGWHFSCAATRSHQSEAQLRLSIFVASFPLAGWAGLLLLIIFILLLFCSAAARLSLHNDRAPAAASLPLRLAWLSCASFASRATISSLPKLPRMASPGLLLGTLLLFFRFA